ncbi:hypothetical protein AVEN_65143-1 [Araneus ventricosus]|uniref:Latrotoxin C-terminal domain-containing protein n=1 Tax=Araneus ventricosus TaxID=182803 RepID=A0A4Y2AFH8_ARAVE|nr:hypothetical protein AVEN_65143-1 [Araneus ventricosus]
MENSQTSKAMTTQSIDTNGTLLLLDVFIRKITGQKCASTADQPTISLPKAVFYASDIINGFERAVEQTASKSGMSMQRLVDIDSMEMREEITGKIMGGKFNEIPRVLISYAEKACPGKEAGCPGKLSPKKFDKFMTIFKHRINITLDESVLQILHSEHNKSKVKNTEEQQRNLKDKKQPRSYLDDSSVQGLLTQAVVSK